MAARQLRIHFVRTTVATAIRRHRLHLLWRLPLRLQPILVSSRRWATVSNHQDTATTVVESVLWVQVETAVNRRTSSCQSSRVKPDWIAKWTEFNPQLLLLWVSAPIWPSWDSRQLSLRRLPQPPLPQRGQFVLLRLLLLLLLPSRITSISLSAAKKSAQGEEECTLLYHRGSSSNNNNNSNRNRSAATRRGASCPNLLQVDIVYNNNCPPLLQTPLHLYPSQLIYKTDRLLSPLNSLSLSLSLSLVFCLTDIIVVCEAKKKVKRNRSWETKWTADLLFDPLISSQRLKEKQRDESHPFSS